MKEDKPLTLEEKIDAIMVALSRIEARQIAFRRVIVPRSVAGVSVPEEEEQSDPSG